MNIPCFGVGELGSNTDVDDLHLDEEFQTISSMYERRILGDRQMILLAIPELA